MDQWTDVPTGQAPQPNAPAATNSSGWTDVQTPQAPQSTPQAQPVAARSPWQRFTDSFVKADLNGFGGWAARRILEATDGLGMVPKPPGMSDARYHAILHQAVNSNQADVLQNIAHRDAADPLVNKNGNWVDTAEHVGSSVAANLTGGASPAYAIAPASGLGMVGRVGAAGLINAGQDTAMQGLQLQDQTRQKFDPGEVAQAGALGGLFQGGLEGLGAGVSALKGMRLTRSPEAKGWADATPENPAQSATPAPEGVEPAASTPEPAGRGVPANKAAVAQAWEDVPVANTTKDTPSVQPQVVDGQLDRPFSFDQNVYDHTPEVLQHVADNIHGKSLPEAAAWMHDNSDGAMQQIFGRLQQRLSDLDDVGIKGKINVGETQPGQAGEAFIEPRTGDQGGQTFLSNGEEGPNFGVNLRRPDLSAPYEIPGTSPGVVLHELTHAATIGLAEAVRARPNSPKLAPFVKPVNDLDALWQHVQDHVNSFNDVGVPKNPEAHAAFKGTNIHEGPEELLAWGMSDPKVQSVLKNIPYKATTAWNAFTGTVRKLLGIKSTDTSAMDALLQTFDHMTGDQDAYIKAHTIFDKYGRISRSMATKTGSEGEEPSPDVAESGPKKAGNINLSRLGTPEEVNETIKEQAESLKLDPVTHDQLIAKTEKLLQRFTPEQLLARNPRLNTAPEYGLAIRTVLAQSSRRLVDASQAVLDDLARDGRSSPDTLQKVQEYRLLTAAAVERNSKLANVAGRMLNQYRISLDRGGHALPPGTEEIDLEQFAKMMVQFKNNPNARASAAAQSFQLHWDDYAKELWYNMRLASLDTHALLFASNAGNLGMSIFEHGAASLMGQFRRFGPQGLDRITGREVAARVYGIWRGLTAAKTYQDTATAFLTGHPTSQAAKVQTHTNLPDWIKTPSKGIAAADQWWQGILKASDFSGMAVRTAYREGKTGQAFWQRVQDLEQNPTREMLSHANDYSKVTQMMDDPSWLGKGLEKIKATPAQSAGNWERLGRFFANMLVPFPRITDGIFRTAVRYSPLGFMDRYNIADFKAGGARKDLALSRIMGGTAVMTLMGMMATTGAITGDGPDDFRKKEELEATGWRPNSIKVGDKYYSYGGLGPAATQMNILATTIERWQAGELKDEGVVNNLANTAGSIASSMSKNNWTNNLGDVFKAFEPGEQGSAARANLAGNLAQGMVEPTILREVNQDYIDRAQRDTTGNGSFADRVAGHVEATLPGLSKNLPQKQDVFGRPETRPDTLGPRILSKIYISPEDKDAAVQEVGRLTRLTKGALVGPPSKSITGYDANDQKTTKRLTADEFEKYQHLSGQYILEGIHTDLQNPAWKTASDQDKIDEIKSIVKDARSQARDELFFSAPTTAQPQPASQWRDVK